MPTRTALAILIGILLATTTLAIDLADVEQDPRYEAMLARTTGPMARLLADPNLELLGVLPSGRPVFFATHNLDAAYTVATDAVWPGGWTGLDLVGANTLGELAIWDGGVVRTSHQEFGGRVVIADGNTSISIHSTHVAGTMVAAGVESQAHGMSPAANLLSYRWDDDEFEMAFAATNGLRVSNHSYGFVTGWRYGWASDDWYWFGDTTVSQVEDPGFGFYSGSVAEWDQIAHDAPYYLIVKSAGNDRNDFGPDAGGGHYVWDNGAGDWTWSTTTRDPDGGDDGFDCVSYRGNAKNLLTVGAVIDIPGGWTTPTDVVASDFTGWGPTDDGRVKPDLVANGVGLYSAFGGSDTEYGIYSGTSMAAPNASGSLNLLVQQYQQLHGGASMTAALLKAVVLHTADEAGPAPGPDYMFGWGLLNTAAAAVLIDDDAGGGRRLVEATLTSSATDQYRYFHDGSGPVKVSLVWTDPAGNPPPWSLNPTTPMLVNDLDLRLIREDDGAVFRPWLLDPNNPAAAAGTGQNHRDNVEILEVSGVGAGTYRAEVSHTGGLTGSQDYGLVVTDLQRISLTAAGELVVATPRLLRAAPNPFNPRTEITLSLDRTREVRLEVFDARGRRIAVLVDGPLDAGEHRVTWDGRTEQGRSAPAGVYLVRMQAGNQSDRLRVSLVK